MLYCVRQVPAAMSGCLTKEQQQRLIASAFSALTAIAYARTKVQAQGFFTRQALANVGLQVLAKADSTYRSRATRATAGLLSVSLLLANRTIFDYVFLNSMFKKYGFYALYMSNVAQRSLNSLCLIELLYQGIVQVKQQDILWVRQQCDRLVWQLFDKLCAVEPRELFGRVAVLSADSQCSICLGEDAIDNPLKSFCAERSHIAHASCMHNWYERKQQCPMCRGPLVRKTRQDVVEEIIYRVKNPFSLRSLY